MIRRTISSALAPLVAWGIAASLAPQASASGFNLKEQSPSLQGMSFAGASSGGSDIGGMYFNPASMALFQGNQAILGASFVILKAELENAEAHHPALGDVPGSSHVSNAANSALLPNLYAMWSLNPDLKLGLSVNVPFGMGTEYDGDFVGRYHALKSDLSMIDFAPSIAYRINPQWSLGGTFVARKADAELTNAVYVGTEAKATLKADSWGYGYRVGVIYQPTETLRFGLAHQAAITVKLKGDVAFTGTSLLANGGVSADLDLPATTSLGVSADISPTVSLHGEIAKTDWSSFRQLRIKFDTGLPDSVTDERWRDTWFYALGLTWKATDAWTFRTGIAHDQSAVEDKYRTPRIPDSDRTWVSVGVGYAFSQRVSMDFAYTHLFMQDGPLTLTGAPPDQSRGSLTGNYKNCIDILSAQARFNF